MTPVLCELHWLPIRQRITFNTAVLAYKCQHGAAPQYLQSYCESTSMCTGRRYLCSSQMRQLVVPRTRTKYGDRSFAVWGPRVWNSLPVELRTPDISLIVFRNKLKTFLTKWKFNQKNNLYFMLIVDVSASTEAFVFSVRCHITASAHLRHHFLVALQLLNLCYINIFYNNNNNNNPCNHFILG